MKPFRGSVLASAALGAALTPLNSTMVAVALPALAEQFSSSAASVTVFVVTGYLIATLVLSVPGGSVADRVGYARALTWGRWMFVGGSIVGAVAPTLSLVVIGRLLMATGGALINPTAMALLRTSVAPERRARAFGTMGAVMGGAAAIGPGLGQWMTAEFGWRMLFVVNLPLLVISWLLEPRGGAEAVVSERQRSTPFDWPGSVLLGGALVGVMIATRVPVPLAYGCAAAGAVACVALVLHERRIERPVLNLSFFRLRGFVAGAGVIAAQNLAMYSLLIQIPFLYGGADGSGLGLAIVAMTLTMAATSPLGGWLVEWIGVRAVVTAGGLVAAAGVVGLTRLALTASPADIAVPLLLVGLGLGLSTGPANAAAVTAVPPHQSAMASATVSMLRYLGAIGGTVILSVAMSPGQARPALALWSFVTALVLSALLGLVLPAHAGEQLRSRQFPGGGASGTT